MSLFRGRSGKIRPCARFVIAAAAASPIAIGAAYCPAATPTFTSGITTGNIQNSTITEASGIAASRKNANVLWTHDDSGSGPTVVPMTPAGANLGTYTISGAGSTDWEDIAVGPGPTAGAQYLYVGDIGDNFAVRSSGVQVYRVPEPTVSDTQTPMTLSISGAVQFNFVYPNGPHDAESLFIDPLTRDIYIVSKRESTKYVYRAAYPQSSSGTTTMELVASLSNASWLTAADISPDGDEIIVRSTATNTGLLYTRPAGGSIADAFATTPVSIPLLSEAQGEAIGFDPQGWGYYTTTEGATAPIHYFNRLSPPAGTMYWDNDGVSAGSYTTSGAGMGGTGTWNASALKWYTGSAEVPWVNGNNAVFWGTAGTVTLAAAQSVNSLTFKTNGYVVAGSTLTLGGSSVTVDAGVTATVSSVIAGSAGLVKNGAGTLQLATANTYTGGTTVNAGVLGIVSSSLGASLASPAINVTINNGATLRFDVNGLTLSANRHVLLGPGGGVIDVQNFIDSIAGVISGSSLTKTGTGTLTLMSNNIYTGGTIVNAGTLKVNRLHENSAVTIASGVLQVVASSPTIPSHPSGSNASVSRPSSLTIANNGAPLGSRVYNGTLDLANNDLILDYSGASPIAVIEDMVRSGYNLVGNWAGTGIRSSVAAVDGNYVVAVADNAALATPFGTANGGPLFAGQDVDLTTILVKFTHRADVDLNGVITPNDSAIFGGNYSEGDVANWATGDMDYDGVFTPTDAAIFGGFYDESLVSLPEPAALGLIGLLLLALAPRHRGHNG